MCLCTVVSQYFVCIENFYGVQHMYLFFHLVFNNKIIHNCTCFENSMCSPDPLHLSSVWEW